MDTFTTLDLLLPVALFAAAAVQAAGGLGFGLVAGPVLVAALGLPAGFQAAILLNLLAALTGWALSRREARYDLLRPMAPGVAIGVGVGLVAATLFPEWLLKVAMCMALGWVWLAPATAATPAPGSTFRLAAMSGAMGGALAIPGPAAAVHLRRVSNDARTFRGSMMPLLFVVYLGVGAGMVALRSIEPTAIATSFAYLPAVFAGLVVGRAVSRRVSEPVLELLTRALLALTFAALAWAVLVDLRLLL